MLCECVEFLRHRIWLLRPVRSQVWCLKINTRPPYGAILRARQHGCPPVVPHPESLAAQAAYTECSISLMDIVILTFPNKAPSLSLSKPERGEAGLPWHLKTVTWCSMRANQGRGRAPGSECYRPLYSPLSAAGEPSVERECGLGFMPLLRAKGLLHPATYTLHPKLNPIKPNPLFPLKKVLTKSMTK